MWRENEEYFLQRIMEGILLYREILRMSYNLNSCTEKLGKVRYQVDYIKQVFSQGFYSGFLGLFA